MRRVILGLTLMLVAVLSACAPAPREVRLDNPKETLVQAVKALRSVQSFRLLIEQLGTEYRFAVSLDEGASSLSAFMRRAEAQYLMPNQLSAKVTLRIDPLPAIGVEIFAQGVNQWFRLLSGNWINYPVAEGFNPEQLIREGSGFSIALEQLRDITFVGVETLIDGTETYHIRGFANGNVVNELMFNLVTVAQDNVIVDVFVNTQNGLPAKVNVKLPNTATEGQGDTEWNIELYDYDAPFSLPYPNTVTLEGAGS